MSPLRFSLGAFAVLAVGAAVACSSSSSNNNAGDAGTDDGSTSTGPEAGLPGINATCGFLAALTGGGSCPKGQTCCTMISAAGGSASCVASASSCSGGITTACSSAADCSSGQVCCVGSPDGGALGMMGATDAAAAAGNPLAGLGNFDPSTLSATCQSSCAPSQTQQCAMDSECPSGEMCVGFGGFGGAGGDGGAAGGLGGLFGNIMLPKTCMTPREAGAPPPPQDSGTTEDTGSSEDAGTSPPDAGMSDVAAGD